MREIIPEVPKALLDHLKEAFPNTLPTDAHFNERDVAAAVGAQRVIDHLQALHEHAQSEQAEASLWNTPYDSE